jgi:hypothetical protein
VSEASYTNDGLLSNDDYIKLYTYTPLASNLNNGISKKNCNSKILITYLYLSKI